MIFKYVKIHDSHMEEPICVKDKKEAVRHSTDEPREFDIDFIISKMKEVGYRNSEGILILPKYYDE